MRRVIVRIGCLALLLVSCLGSYWKQRQNDHNVRSHYPYIRNVADGDTMSGEKLLEVAYLQDGGPHIMHLFLDDEEINVSSPTLQLEPEKFIEISLDTRHYANGPHTLRVTDYNRKTDTRKVKFYNTIAVTEWISGFSLHSASKSKDASVNSVAKSKNAAAIRPPSSKSGNASGFYDPSERSSKLLGLDTPPPTEASFTASLASQKQWTATIRTTREKQAVLRTFHGNGNKIEVTWNGKDAKGREVPDGNYALIVHVAGWKNLEYNINKF